MTDIALDHAPDATAAGGSPDSVALPAVEPGWAARVMRHPELLTQIATAVGGPFHVLCADQFVSNAEAFVAALDSADVNGKVYFGKKANKTGCFAAASATARCGVDVASAPELVNAMAHGVRGQDLVVTGPAKRSELILLAARHGALLAVDALDELDRVLAVAESVGKTRILLRVLPASNPESRFGLDADELRQALGRCARHRDILAMEGFSFHLTGYDIAPRAWQAAELVDQCLAAQQMGLTANSVSIGGGFPVSYVESGAWEKFQAHYDDSWFHTRKTFGGFYPYHQRPAGASALSDILTTAIPSDHGNLANKLSCNDIQLLLEPGRALLDGCGFTAFPVLGYKPRPDYGFLTVDGLSLSLSEQWFHSEYLPDPTLWPPGEGESISACVGGSSCLESDMLTWRRLRFPRRPRHGDLLIYPNTAGYQMDSNESEFHQLPLPTKVVVSTDGLDDSGMWWRLA